MLLLAALLWHVPGLCVRVCVSVRDTQEEFVHVCVQTQCEWDNAFPMCVYVCVYNDSSASCSPVKMTRSCQINIITIRV